MVCGKHIPVLLGVHLRREGCGALEIAEHHRELTPLCFRIRHFPLFGLTSQLPQVPGGPQYGHSVADDGYPYLLQRIVIEVRQMPPLNGVLIECIGVLVKADSV